MSLPQTQQSGDQPKEFLRQQPLCVDLDGTLVKSDLLVEACFQLLRKNALFIFLMPIWLMRGKAFFKEQVFSRTPVDAESLPYNEPLLAYLKEELSRGRLLVLATASPRIVADAVADHLGIFSVIVCSDAQINMSGSHKAQTLVRLFGVHGYHYAGNSQVDLYVWANSSQAIVVNPPMGLLSKAIRIAPVGRVFNRRVSVLKSAIKAMRPHQWAKNTLVFLPLLLAHQITDLNLLMNGCLAFVAFALVSSSVYLLNDLLDINADRHHPDNSRRPFASGDLPLLLGVALIPILLSGGLIVGYQIGFNFLLALIGYHLLTTVYSFYLKQIVMADVVVLAFLYAIRMLAGSIASNVVLSSWLLAFAGFFFLSLALVKRCSEIILLKKVKSTNNPNRGYWIDDLQQLTSFGTTSAYLSVLVLALYISGGDVTRHYPNATILWAVCPLLLYWISRVWLKAHRGQMHTDPLVFALKDRVSYGILSCVGLIWFAASGWTF